MTKARNLTDVEKFYIENNLNQSDSKIASKMQGVGVKTVSKYKESIKTETVEKETDKERIHRLGNGPETGSFIQTADNGATIMTQQASEVSDAKREVKGASYGDSPKRPEIHKPQS